MGHRVAPIGESLSRGFKTRRVNSGGDTSWHKDGVFISQVFSFEDLGFEETDEEIFRVYCRDALIGPDGRVNGLRATPDTFKAYMAGEQRYTGTKAVPILAICSESHSYGVGFGMNSPDQAAKFLAEEKSLIDEEVTAFAKGNPAAQIVRVPDSNNYIFLSNGEQVATEIVTFISGLH